MKLQPSIAQVFKPVHANYYSALTVYQMMVILDELLEWWDYQQIENYGPTSPNQLRDLLYHIYSEAYDDLSNDALAEKFDDKWRSLLAAPRTNGACRSWKMYRREIKFLLKYGLIEPRRKMARDFSTLTVDGSVL